MRRLSQLPVLSTLRAKAALSARRGGWLVAVLLWGLAGAACSSDTVDEGPPADFIAVKQAWLPGERDAYLQRVMTNHELVLPYVGDISAMAPQLFADLDSHTVMVPNPALAVSLTAPTAGPGMAPRLSVSWNFFGLMITTVNTTGSGATTSSWHMVVWSNPSNALDHGYAIAASNTPAFNIQPINVAAFDASSATSGAAGGEYHGSNGTGWEDDATGGRFQVTSQSYAGAFATIAAGPYQGGVSRSGRQFGRVVSSTMVRQQGTELPSSFTVSVDYRSSGIHATEILCNSPTPCSGTELPTTEFIMRRRAWQPGERDTLIARIIAQRALVIPYLGDMSDYAASFYRADSVDEVVLNPDYAPAASDSPFGSMGPVNAPRVPGTGWTSSAIDVHVVNAQQGNDTFDWLGVFWTRNTEPMWKGFIIAATANATLPATTVNTTTFDAANAKSGVGAGEGRSSTATVWTANGTGSPNQFSVTSSSGVGGTATITTGPFLGGTQQGMNMAMRINNVGLTRVLGTGTPATQTASLTGNLTGTRFVCLFPTPCTTNVPAVIAAARRGPLPDSLLATLPWIAARPSRRR